MLRALFLVVALAGCAADGDAPTRDLHRWIDAKAIEIRSADPAGPIADLGPLRAVIGNASVVGVGEATHGSSEFFTVKHRLFRFLVERMGFTVFAIEANLPDAERVNAYILTGNGDAKQALAGMYFWTWDTYEVLALIEWMREWNADPKHSNKLKFYGVDMQFTSTAARAILDALPADTAGIDAIRPLLTDGRKLTEEERAAARRVISTNVPQLVKDDRLHRFAVVLQQNLAPGGEYDRDRSMADNLLWIRNRERHAKIMLWAHNAHIARVEGWMGNSLNNALGKQYLPIGFTFGRGSFNAIDIEAFRVKGRRKQLNRHSVPLHGRGTLDGELARSGPPLYAIDLRSAPPPVADWLRSGVKLREYGSAYGADIPPRTRTLSDFDVLVSVRNSSAAHPTPTGKR